MTSQTAEQTKANIAANLKAAREEQGLSQRELAVAADVAEMQVSRWERGVFAPTHSNLIKLAAALKRDAGWFYDEPRKAVA